MSDFGIARLGDISPATLPGTITGTPRFSSPEALAGEPVGPAHDVYCLDMTLYALLSGGQFPYEVTGQASVASLRRLQLTRIPALVKTFVPEIDPAVDRLLREGLSADPGKRPAMRKVVLTLERAQARASASRGPKIRSAGSGQ